MVLRVRRLAGAAALLGGLVYAREVEPRQIELVRLRFGCRPDITTLTLRSPEA